MGRGRFEEPNAARPAVAVPVERAASASKYGAAPQPDLEKRPAEGRPGALSVLGNCGWEESDRLGYTTCTYVDEAEGIEYTIDIVGIDGCAYVYEAHDELRRELEPTASTQAPGEGDPGEWWDVPLSLAEIVELRANNLPVFPNLLYFFKPNYTFHPDQEPIPAASPGGIELEGEAKKVVMTLDTPHVAGHVGAYSPSGNLVDPYSYAEEIVWGHGPAIADLVGRLLGEADHSLLRGIDGSKGCHGSELAIRHGINLKDAANDRREYVRCFDTKALHHALAELEPLAKSFDVLNLSLGTLSCPSLMGAGDPIHDWLRRWETVFEVTVAAGNHNDGRPSYPAAYHESFQDLFSVGSGQSLQQLDPFSAKGSFVSSTADGNNVTVKFPDNPGSTDGYRTWTGTSFAAPKMAALRATL